MATTDEVSIYTVLEKLIRYLEKKDVDVKIINLIKECKDLKSMR